MNIQLLVDCSSCPVICRPPLADGLDDQGLGTPLANRNDERGQLALAFEHMSERPQG
ncbi:hypothetical protein [Pseudomonas sp. LD120]|uniref:HAMP domain-containing protein n=1 Tax=Pseudomonas sp. LD120 TaxID=485751 RepID=UPI00135A9664|nr:hypothetical protein [Pseudomonas sp. LD120]KAF0866224.1 hypothetical protein PLD_13520 [Pseudomonas sp. LD120]